MKDQKTGLTQHGREQGIRRLMSINLLKRLESSVYSFRLTLLRIKTTIDDTINLVEQFKLGNRLIQASEIREANEFDDDDLNTELFSVGNKVKINLSDMDYLSWQRELKLDSENLDLLINMIEDITPEHDSKLQSLHALIDNKMENPINSGNKKILIFTAFSDTADYLYKHVSQYMKQAYGLNTAEITGSVDGKSTIPNLRSDLNTVLTCFSPISKDKDMLMPNDNNHLDILVATDCISEGQNLQDCDYVINYDIHWNPVRIIQRFGRIDRIGSKNDKIQLVNFWPDLTLDDYINLKARVETRMKISVMTSTGDDNPLSEEEKGELEYRKQQLKRLQEEVVDIEDMSSGISIMDLGLNEFRLDLLDYIKRNHDIETAPHGMHAVVEMTEDAPAGVIYVLRNVNNSVNIDHQNLLHPFYMVYISDEGEVICDHLSPKMLLDKMRLLCKGHTEPEEKLYSVFNKETKDGKNMSVYSQLLSEVIDSIIQVKEESDLDSFFQGKSMSFVDNQITGLDNFELICFLVVK
jgi:SNF2 family DNA or RNA helicase